MWSIGTILNGLLSFMYENNMTTGSISSSKTEKKRLAGSSLEQNLKSPVFRKLFPNWVEEHQRRQQAKQVRLCTSLVRHAFTKQNWLLLHAVAHTRHEWLVLHSASGSFVVAADSYLFAVVQEEEERKKLQPATQQIATAKPSTKSTIGSTLITLGIVTAVFGLLMVPLLSK